MIRPNTKKETFPRGSERVCLSTSLSEPLKFKDFKIQDWSSSRLRSLSLVLDQLLLDILGHLVVQSQLLPLGLELASLAVPADEPVEPGGDVVLDEVLRVDVEGLQEPRVALEKVLLVVSAEDNCYKIFWIKIKLHGLEDYYFEFCFLMWSSVEPVPEVVL